MVTNISVMSTEELLSMLSAMMYDAEVRAELGRNMLMLRETFKVLRAELLRRTMPAIEVKHKQEGELKASCQIRPITRIDEGRSSKEELVEWCNNLAISSHTYNPGRASSAVPHYRCTLANFGRIDSPSVMGATAGSP